MLVRKGSAGLTGPISEYNHPYRVFLDCEMYILNSNKDVTIGVPFPKDASETTCIKGPEGESSSKGPRVQTK